MYSTISKIIPAQKITVNLVVFNLVVKMHNGRSRNYYKVGFNFRLEMIRLKLAKFRLNIPIGYGPRPFQLCYQKSDHLDGLCRTRNCRPTGLTEDQQGPALSYLRTEDRFVIPKDHSGQLDPPSDHQLSYRSTEKGRSDQFAISSNKDFQVRFVIQNQVQHRNSSTSYVSE